MQPYRNLDRLSLPPGPQDAPAQLVRLLDALVDDYGADRIIAFGSCVRGASTRHSDIDLCIVREHPPDCTHPGLSADLAAQTAATTLSKDLLVRTPAQWKSALRRRNGVMHEVVEHGLVLYERHPAESPSPANRGEPLV